ncbi:MAG: S8 family serine peptidase, partial [Planctomycetota bacterium]
MIVHPRFWQVVGLCLVVVLGSPRWAVADAEDQVPDQIVLELFSGADIEDINDTYGTETIGSIPHLRLYLLDLEGAVENVLEALLEDGRIAETERNMWAATPESVGGDTQPFFFYVPPSFYDEQYASGLLGLGPAFGISTGSGVVVAVLDTGVDAAHEALAEMILSSGYNFVDDNEDVADVGNGVDDDEDGEIDEMTGHGTAISGIVARVAPDASILPVRILDSDGVGDTFRTAQGIYYAIEQGAHVINLSLGTPSNNQVLRAAVDAAQQAGVIVVASAGNSNRQHPVQMPAGHDHAIGVASTDQDDIKSGFSNYGTHLGISAPGTNVVSTVPQDAYARCSGTSLASAFVAGTAALVKALDPQAPPEQVAAALLQTTEDVDACNPDFAGLLGTGRLSVAAAVGLVRSPADLDGDWLVGVSDFLILLAAWDETSSPADIDGDGVVGIGDFLLL